MILKFLTIAVFLPMACSDMPDHDWTDDSTEEDCPAACVNIATLECPGHEGSPGEDEEWGTLDDRSCEQVCRAVMKRGEKTLYPKCVAAASSCDAVEECFVD